MIQNINVVTASIIVLALAPVIVGLMRPFSKDKIQYSLGALLHNIEFLAGIIISVYLTKQIFFQQSTGFYKVIYNAIPEKIRLALYGNDILTYIAAVPAILLIITLLLRLLFSPVYHALIVPLSERIYGAVNSKSLLTKHIIGGLWQLPKSAYIPLIFVLVLNLHTYYFYSPQLTKWMNQSSAYQYIYKNALYPILNSNMAKEIPVLLNDSFKEAMGGVIAVDGSTIVQKIGNTIAGGNLKVIEYFNGVTLDEAIKSNEEIDSTAREIVKGEDNSTKKAYKIYKWVSSNVEYDYDKAEKIVGNSKSTSSGAIVAFNTRKGICFDYSSLYIAMCRAAGLKVRLATGLGYSGVSWGDHAWNQVYSYEEDRWINVDATFGSSGVNYFDKPDFNADHRYVEVQGEW